MYRFFTLFSVKKLMAPFIRVEDKTRYFERYFISKLMKVSIGAAFIKKNFFQIIIKG